jgi:hypothetical protein
MITYNELGLINKNIKINSECKNIFFYVNAEPRKNSKNSLVIYQGPHNTSYDTKVDL